MWTHGELAFEMLGENAPVNNTIRGGGFGMRFDEGLMRPYFEDNPNSALRGQRCVTLDTGRKRSITHNGKKVEVPVFKEYRVVDLQRKGINSPVFNSTSLRKEEWLHYDRKIQEAARYELTAWTDLKGANPYGGFNAMGKSILEYETMSDPGIVQVDMDGLTEGRNDSPLFQLQGTPLPITHGDFYLSNRRLAESRNSGTPLDTRIAETKTRRIAETLEKTTIGIQTGLTYGGNSTQVGGYGRASSVYGYLNFPSRLTATGLFKPTGLGRSGTGWKAEDTVKDVLACLDLLRAQKFKGPFMVYHSNDWDQYMDADYTLTGGNVTTQTLRNRLRAIDRIKDVKRLDFLFSTLTGPDGLPLRTRGPGLENLSTVYPFTMIFVQMTPDVCQGINGMEITVLQWETVGGMRQNFKIMCIQVPRIMADFYGNCGILQATFDEEGEA